MTVTEIRDEVAARVNATSAVALTRILRNINTRYKRLTSSVGLQTSRRDTVFASMTIGVSTLTFTGIEKIISVSDRSSGTDRFLEEVTPEELTGVLTGRPVSNQSGDFAQVYAVERVGASTVTIRLGYIPQAADTYYANGYVIASALSGSQEPAFPESFHDILVFGALADEYRKLEKIQLARDAEKDAEDRTGELRLFLATSVLKDIYQGKTSASSFSNDPGGGGGGSSTTTGGMSYEQTGLITFSRAPSAPFAVESGSAKVSNLDADLLDGFSEAAFAKLADNETITGDYTFDGALILPDATVPAQTADASVVWDSNDNLLTVGTGSGRKTMVDTDSTQTITGKSIDASQLTGSIADARLSSNVPLENTANVFTSSNTFNGSNLFSGPTSIDTNPLTLTVGQIVFPASQNASSGVNTLDDYEEGTWSPGFGGTGGQSGQVYSLQSGLYTKIGRVVHFYGRLTLSTLGTITTTVIITGLPFTALTTQSGAMSIGYWANMTTSFGWLGGYVEANTTRIVLTSVINNVTGVSTLVQGDLSATTDMIISGTYFV